MRSHETGEYDLSCDGNVNRILTWIFENVKEDDVVDIYLPNPETLSMSQIQNINKFNEKKERLRIMVVGEWPMNAGAERKEGILPQAAESVSFNEDVNFKFNPWQVQAALCYNYDCIVYESEADGELVEKYKQFAKKSSDEACPEGYTTIFMCPVSSVGDKNYPSFLKDVFKQDQKLAKACDKLIVANEAQKDYFKSFTDESKISIISHFITKDQIDFSPNFNQFKAIEDYDIVIYFPFRISDSGYHFDKVVQAMEKMHSACLAVTDPNDSLYTDKAYIAASDKVKSSIVHLPKNKDAYYTMLKYGRVVIPYLENDVIRHASADEFEIFGTFVIHADGEDISSDELQAVIEESYAHKKDLVSVEGFDRAGKSSVIKECKTREAITYEEPKDRVPYREQPEKFMSQVHDVLGEQGNWIRKSKSEKFIIGRLLCSYKTYNALFVRSAFAQDIEAYFHHLCSSVRTVAILYESYDAYKLRCAQLVGKDADCKIEYSKDEFDEIQKDMTGYSDKQVYITGNLSSETDELTKQGFFEYIQ